MKHGRSLFTVAGVVMLVAGGWGCGAPGSSAHPEAYEARPVSDPAGTSALDEGPRWVVRIAGDSEDHQRQIRRFTVAGDYIYFTTGWEGIYRVSRQGGAIEVVEAPAGALFEHLASVGSDVYWMHSTFDERDYPRIRVKTQAAGGAAIRTLFEGDLATLSDSRSSQFQATAEAVVMNGQRSGQADNRTSLLSVSVRDGALTALLPIEDVFQSPAWAMDGGRLYFSPRTPEASLRHVGLAGGDPQDLAPLPARDTEVRAVDASHVFLGSSRGLWKVARQAGEAQPLATVGEGSFISQHLQIDERNVYFAQRGPGGTDLRALPKAGGEAVVLLDDADTVAHIGQLGQDADNLYLLIGWREIRVVPKTPAVAAQRRQ
jgi:hypothetical protein